jgi:hypothetical protein
MSVSGRHRGDRPDVTAQASARCQDHALGSAGLTRPATCLGTSAHGRLICGVGSGSGQCARMDAP